MGLWCLFKIISLFHWTIAISSHLWLLRAIITVLERVGHEVRLGNESVSSSSACASFGCGLGPGNVVRVACFNWWQIVVSSLFCLAVFGTLLSEERFQPSPWSTGVLGNMAMDMYNNYLGIIVHPKQIEPRHLDETNSKKKSCSQMGHVTCVYQVSMGRKDCLDTTTFQVPEWNQPSLVESCATTVLLRSFQFGAT